jgi:Fe-Mn family superoxide dismutase
MGLFEPKPFPHLLGAPGLEDALLKQHLDLYAGHLNTVNELVDELADAPVNGTPPSDWSEQKRRFGWEWNGLRLHELYFENLTRFPAPPGKSAGIGRRLATQFGSFQSWAKDFRTTGSIRGVGWAALVWDCEADRFHNIWINENDTGHLVGSFVLLLMDVFEHAYVAQYGARRAAYIDAFMAAIDWSVAESRLAAAEASVPALARS